MDDVSRLYEVIYNPRHRGQDHVSWSFLYVYASAPDRAVEIAVDWHGHRLNRVRVEPGRCSGLPDTHDRAGIACMNGACSGLCGNLHLYVSP